MKLFNFNITSDGEISQLFKQNYCFDFLSASEFVRNLPYQRNLNKDNLATVFTDNCGTCSTKHALLKKLAEDDFTVRSSEWSKDGIVCEKLPSLELLFKKYNKYKPFLYSKF